MANFVIIYDAYDIRVYQAIVLRQRWRRFAQDRLRFAQDRRWFVQDRRWFVQDRRWFVQDRLPYYLKPQSTNSSRSSGLKRV